MTEEATQPSPLSDSGGVAGSQQQVNLNKDMVVNLILSVVVVILKVGLVNFTDLRGLSRAVSLLIASTSD